MRRFNKLEEAVLKMVHKRSKIDSIEGMEWDEYGNPKPILTGLSKILWGDSDTCSVTFYPKDDEQDIIESNVIENDDTTGI
jgi:hypothetical protein